LGKGIKNLFFMYKTHINMQYIVHKYSVSAILIFLRAGRLSKKTPWEREWKKRNTRLGRPGTLQGRGLQVPPVLLPSPGSPHPPGEFG
jgi:hypothetical protein